jgi:predicted RNA-binding Zn-ribbon protein involved in translation (DUF1610 family)
MALIPKQIVDKNGKLTTVHVSDAIKTKETRHKNGTVSISVIPREETIGGWEIAPEGHTGYGCPFCGTFYTEEQRDAHQDSRSGECIECGNKFESGDALIGVTQEALPFFDDQNVRDSDWYHATVIDDWHGEVIRGIGDGSDEGESAMVHLGTLQAALDRMKFVNDFQNSGQVLHWRVHKIRLEPNIPIHSVVIDDDHAEPKTVYQADDRDDYDGDGATRYVNRYESEGTISLTVNPNALDVIETFVLDDTGNLVPAS